MPRRRIITLIAAALLLVPGAALAQSADDLVKQIATLMQQINAVQAQIGAAPAPSASTALPVSANTPTSLTSAPSAACPRFTRTLTRGLRGDDVLALQRYLGDEGLLASDAQTGYFGALTEGALQKWQSTYKIATGGTPATTGWGTLGPRTMRMIDLNCTARVQTPRMPAIDPASSLPSCPLAPRPAILCSGSWRAVSDANGCTTSWQCAVPLQPSTTTAPTTQTTTPTPISCPVNPRPNVQCSGSWHAATDSRGCTASWLCI